MSTLREFYRPWKLTHLALVRERLARGTRCIACPHFISEGDEGTVIYLMGETPPRRLPKRRHIGVACQDCIEHALTYHGAGDLPRRLHSL
jgi:hypothetical protein